MNWFEEHKAIEADNENRKALVVQHASEVYEALWKQLKELIAQAQKSGLPVLTNGSPEKRKVILAEGGKPSQPGADPHVLWVELNRAQGTISTKGYGKPLVFTLEVCDDGVVCLQHEGLECATEQAAQMILGPLFFKHLRG